MQAEETDDDGNEPINSIHHHRFSMRDSVRASVRAFELGALTVHHRAVAAAEGEEEDHHTRTIGGRLGGHVDSIRSFVLDQQEQEERFDTEGTPLVQEKKKKLAPPPPPLAIWIFPALCCALSYAMYNICIKKGSAFIHPILGGVVLQFVAAILGTALLGTMLLTGAAKQDSIHYDRIGFFWSVCAGLAVGTAEMLSFFVSSLGVQASQFIPVIIGGSVLFGCLLGLLILGEKLMLQGWSGVLLLVTGIALVATDPGDKVEESSTVSHKKAIGKLVPPPLAMWIAPALFCASCYACYNIFIKKGSASINPILGGVILQFVAALFGSLLLGGVIVEEGDTDFLTVSLYGLFWACCAGIAVGTAELLSFCVSGMGVDASKSIPIIIGGSVLFGSILGLLMLGETLMLQGWSGVVILMMGIALVATDPGEKVQGH